MCGDFLLGEERGDPFKSGLCMYGTFAGDEEESRGQSSRSILFRATKKCVMRFRYGEFARRG